jgi:hypothetical protein
MTREEQVRAILKVLAPSSRDRAECWADIEAALDIVASRVKAVGAHRVFGSKEGKLGLRRYRNALRALKAAYAALDPSIAPWFSSAETAQIAGRQTMIDRELKLVEEFIAKKSPGPRRDAITKKAAVAAAHDLLEWRGRKASTTRGALEETVAKLLADDQSDLHDHMRAFRLSRALGVKKIKTQKGRHLIFRRDPG